MNRFTGARYFLAPFLSANSLEEQYLIAGLKVNARKAEEKITLQAIQAAGDAAAFAITMEHKGGRWFKDAA